MASLFSKIFRKNRRGLGFIGLFCIILLFPVYGKPIDRIFSLEGAYENKEKPVMTKSGILDGSYQSDLEKYISENIPGRIFLIKLRNQMLFSFLNTSPNANVTIGKNKSLFEAQYINWQTQVYQLPDEEIKGKVDKLVELKRLLEKNGKRLYLFITPSKAHFWKDEIPNQWNAFTSYKQSNGTYERFMSLLSNTSIDYFNSVEYLENMEPSSTPYFYKSGIHWSQVCGAKTAKEFAAWLADKENLQLPTIDVVVEKTEKPMSPDADLLLSCNLFTEPQDTYYKPIVTKVEGSDKINAFIRGSSFMGQSLWWLAQNNIFNKYFYFENNYYRNESVEQLTTISSFNAYEEVDIKTALENKDIFILEINEGQINRFGYDLVEYLLKNPDYLQAKE